LGQGRSRSEFHPRQENGISHFSSTMCLRDHQPLAAKRIARSVESIGGNWTRSRPRKNWFLLNTKVMTSISAGLRRPLDCPAPPLPRRRHSKETRRDPGKNENDEDQARLPVHRDLSANFLERPPFGKAESCGGTTDTVKAIHIARARELLPPRLYTPEQRWVITAAGNLTHKALVILRAQQFRACTKNGAAPEIGPGTPPCVAACAKRRRWSKSTLCWACVYPARLKTVRA